MTTFNVASMAMAGGSEFDSGCAKIERFIRALRGRGIDRNPAAGRSRVAKSPEKHQDMPLEGSNASQGNFRVLKLGLLGLVIVLVAFLHRFGVLQKFQDPTGLTRALLGLGVWGYLAFIVSYALLQPFGVPGSVFVFAAPLIWPWPIAFALSMTGTMAASVVGFSFARFVARDWVASTIPDRFRKYDQALAARAFSTVFILRFVFWMPQLLHIFLGVSKVPFWTHFWASLAGYAVPLFLVSFFGQQLFNALRGASAGTWLAVGIAVAAVVLGAWALRQRQRSCPSQERR